jgi:hypothetical protein
MLGGGSRPGMDWGCAFGVYADSSGLPWQEYQYDHMQAAVRGWSVMQIWKILVIILGRTLPNLWGKPIQQTCL